MLLSFMELLVAKKTAQPQEKNPKDDLLGHRRTQAATIEPKPRPRRRWLWRKGRKIGVESKFNRRAGDGSGENARRFSYQLTVLSYRGDRMRQRGSVALHDSERASQRRGYSRQDAV